MEGIKDSQAQRMAENLGFLGPLKNQVPEHAEAAVNDLFQKTFANLLTFLEYLWFPGHGIIYCLTGLPPVVYDGEQYFPCIPEQDVDEMCSSMCGYVGTCECCMQTRAFCSMC